jgi:hypothetical protein
MKRPIIISIFCIIGFIGTIATPFALLSSTPISPVSGLPQSAPLPIWYIVVSFIFALGYLFALIEMWKMKKRGVEFYTILILLEYIIGFASGFATISGLVISVIGIGLVWIYYRKMTKPSLFSKSQATLN